MDRQGRSRLLVRQGNQVSLFSMCRQGRLRRVEMLSSVFRACRVVGWRGNPGRPPRTGGLPKTDSPPRAELHVPSLAMF